MDYIPHQIDITRHLSDRQLVTSSTKLNMVYLVNATRVTSAAVILTVLGLVYYAVTSIRSYRKLRHIPGPRLAAFSQLWLFKVTAGGDLYLTAEKVLRKYGT